jgi:hypothetical protein
MKRLVIALAAIGLSSAAFSALPAATDPIVVNIPELDGGFVIGLMGDYLQPSATNHDLDYASLNTGSGGNPLNAPHEAPPFASYAKFINPGYSWGWGANIGYIFPHTGNDINLVYSHLGTSDSASSTTAFPANLSLNPSFGRFTFPFFVSPIADFVSAKAEYTLNQVDLTVGQYINVGCRLRLHPNVGLRWASIDRDLYKTAAGNLNITGFGHPAPQIIFTSLSYTISSHDDSDFEGIGPLAGMDGSYYLGMGFGAVAHADAALLIGSIQDKLTSTYSQSGSAIPPASRNAPTIIFPNVQNFSWSADPDRLVPAFDEKLGVDYSYLFNNAANSDLTLEVGWQASQYFNAVDKTFGFGLLNFSRTLTNGSSFITSHQSSRLGLSGPYATLVLHI